MPDEFEAKPGTTEGPDAVRNQTDEERDVAAAREQGVRTEESDDLSSPQFTTRNDDHEAR